MLRLPFRDIGFRSFGNLQQHVHPTEERVDFRLAQHDLAVLRRDETILHGMGDAHGGMKINDSSRALQRVCGAHERFQLVGRSRAALQFQQAARQYRRLVFRLDPKQFEHREVAQIVQLSRVHVRLRFRV